MKRLHLPAKVPSEGARLLARRIMAAYRGDLPFASQCMQLPITTLQFLVDGSLAPGAELIRDVARATKDGIGRLDWRSAPAGGWFDAGQANA